MSKTLFTKNFLYTKDLSESKYECLIKNCENIKINHLNNSKAFIECSNTMDEVYENIDDYNPSKYHLFLALSLIFLFQKM